MVQRYNKIPIDKLTIKIILYYPPPHSVTIAQRILAPLVSV